MLTYTLFGGGDDGRERVSVYEIEEMASCDDGLAKKEERV